MTERIARVLVVLPVVNGPAIIRDLGRIVLARGLANQLGIDAFFRGRRAIGVSNGPASSARIVAIAHRWIDRVFGVDI